MERYENERCGNTDETRNIIINERFITMSDNAEGPSQLKQRCKTQREPSRGTSYRKLSKNRS
jgi:hypothetical protein